MVLLCFNSIETDHLSPKSWWLLGSLGVPWFDGKVPRPGTSQGPWNELCPAIGSLSLTFCQRKASVGAVRPALGPWVFSEVETTPGKGMSRLWGLG